MEVHSTGVQWPAPLQGPHLLICGSPLPGKYVFTEVLDRWQEWDWLPHPPPRLRLTPFRGLANDNKKNISSIGNAIC